MKQALAAKKKPERRTSSPPQSSKTPQSRDWGSLITYGTVLAAVICGVIFAVHRRWVCDDAFISYRYALNLVEGKGLVFNAAEYVEGYSNFIWTLWCAVALLLKVSCENWTMTWGIICFAGAILLLGYQYVQTRQAIGATGLWLPIAAIMAALHQDWTVYATSGLETSLFIMLAILGYVMLARGVLRGEYQPVAVGIVMTLTALTRPDGGIFAVVGGACLLWFTWPRWRIAATYAAAFAIPQIAFFVWRHRYYGDWLPNTYYAKSGNLAWWSQGLAYLSLYLQKYWIIGLALPALVYCIWPVVNESDRDKVSKLRRLAIMAAAFGGAYAFYVTRVGGDFMYARMLLPATPFFFILIELALIRWRPRLRIVESLICAALVAGLVLPRYPMVEREMVNGVANEWSYYGKSLLNGKDGETMRQYFEGLPVCLAFMGAEANRVYRSRVPTAIESEAGLTDRSVAHQALSERGRIGHEKNAPLEYLIEKRKAHFIFHPSSLEMFRLPARIPVFILNLDGLKGYILHWDPEIMRELKRRGAQFDDVPTYMDGLNSKLNRASDEQVRNWYEMLRLFYFEHVSDPKREAPFLKRLSDVGKGPAR